MRFKNFYQLFRALLTALFKNEALICCSNTVRLNVLETENCIIVPNDSLRITL